MVAEGEHVAQDFKFSISDARKIARSISAFANREGGRLLIGVKDNGVIAGVRNEEDVFVVEQAAERYCVPPQQVEFEAFSIDTDCNVIIAHVSAAAERPVYVRETKGLRAYWRCRDENIAAHPLQVRAWTLKASGAACGFTGIHASVLARVGQGMDIPAIAYSLHLPIKDIEDAVVALAAADTVIFDHSDKGIFVRLPD